MHVLFIQVSLLIGMGLVWSRTGRLWVPIICNHLADIDEVSCFHRAVGYSTKTTNHHYNLFVLLRSEYRLSYHQTAEHRHSSRPLYSTRQYKTNVFLIDLLLFINPSSSFIFCRCWIYIHHVARRDSKSMSVLLCVSFNMLISYCFIQLVQGGFTLSFSWFRIQQQLVFLILKNHSSSLFYT